MFKKTALVLGAGGFIAHHLVTRLKKDGYWVRGVDIKHPEFSKSDADEFVILDLSNYENMAKVIRFSGYHNNFYYSVSKSATDSFDEIYQLAADMGGAGYIFTGDNDANIMENSALINLNLLRSQKRLNDEINKNKTKIFYSSSACVYPEERQLSNSDVSLKEEVAYPANPDSEYGWEKIFGERLFLSFNKNYNIPVAIARYHNVYGPESTWRGGKEKAPAAICRKIIESNNGKIEVWGDGKQTRSFLYIDDCIDATRKLMESNFNDPINIGSEEMVSIDRLIDITSSIDNKKIEKKYINGPTGVYGRNSNNDLIRNTLNWDASVKLKDGIQKTYLWIKQQVDSEV